MVQAWKCLHCGATLGIMAGEELIISASFIMLSGKVKCGHCQHKQRWNPRKAVRTHWPVGMKRKEG